MKHKLLLLLVLIISTSITAQTTRYVKEGGIGDGSSWTQASGDLQEMINASAAGDIVNIAAGTYKPKVDHTGNNNPTDPRTKTFCLKKGVKIHGGWSKTDNPVYNPSMYKTILSGDIGAQEVITDNCYHVMISTNFTNAAYLNGLIFTAGNANGTGSTTVEGLNIDNNSGGGLYIIGDGANLLILNCVFHLNNALYGAGLYVETKAYPTVFNSIFHINEASLGSAIYIHKASAKIRNCVFVLNSVKSGKGTILFDLEESNPCELTNSILHVNSLDGNYDVLNAGICVISSIKPTVSYCVTQKNSAYSSGEGIINNKDPLFISNGGNFELKKNSPCIDKGNNDAVKGELANWPTINNKPRILNNTVDIGVYEASFMFDDDYEPNNSHNNATNLTDITDFTTPTLGLTSTIDDDCFKFTIDGKTCYLKIESYNEFGMPQKYGFYKLYINYADNMLTIETREASGKAKIDTKITLLNSEKIIIATNDNISESNLFSKIEISTLPVAYAGADEFILAGEEKYKSDPKATDWFGRTISHKWKTLDGNMKLANEQYHHLAVQAGAKLGKFRIKYTVTAGTAVSKPDTVTLTVIDAKPPAGLSVIALTTPKASTLLAEMVASKDTTPIWVEMSENHYKSETIHSSMSKTIKFQGWSEVLKIHGDVTKLNLSSLLNEQLYEIDVENNEALQTLTCNSEKKLAKINMLNATVLKSVKCSENEMLSTLNISGAKELQQLYCYKNPKLATLDVSTNINLTKLDCYQNQLSRLDLSKNTKLNYLDCEDNNKISALDLSHNKVLTKLLVQGNDFDACALDALYSSLPNLTGTIYVKNNPGFAKSNTKILINKGWNTGSGDAGDGTGCTGDIAATGVSLNKDNIVLEVGDKFIIEAAVLPANATNKNISWKSNKSDVVYVENDGLLRALSVGNAEITVTTKDGNHTAVCHIIVKKAPTVDVSYLYVSQSGAGKKDGSSWANASDNIQAMIKVAKAGTQIWVAKGTYKPTEDVMGKTTPTDLRNKTFYLKDSVQLYGGFAGTETELCKRDCNKNPTILSGDIGIANDISDNVYHVVVSVKNSEFTKLDGFTITKGNANNSGSSVTVEKVKYENEYGGAIICMKSELRTNNCVIVSNRADWGGGVYAEQNTSFKIHKTKFKNNIANYAGAAFGGTLCNNIIISNCLFDGNEAVVYSGGGFRLLAVKQAFAINCTFVNNKAKTGGAGFAANDSKAKISNCLFNNNTYNGNADVVGADIQLEPGATVHVKNSITQKNSNYSTGNGIINNVDPKFTDTANGDYSLKTGSPAIDKGDNEIINEYQIVTDLLGNARIHNKIVDIGAYENGAAALVFAESIKLDKAKLSLKLKASAQLKVIFTPEKTTDKRVVWSSSDKTIATVDANGKLTAIKAGTATITATSVVGVCKATCQLTVGIPVTGVKLEPTDKTLKVGENFTLKATVEPADATNKKVSYASDKPAIVTVNASGKVKAIKAGKAEITVTTEDGGKTATCTVTVTNATAIESQIAEKIKIYPNPADGRFMLNVPKASKLVITNLSGKIIQEKLLQVGENEVYIKQIGIYLLNISAKDYRIVKKVIIR